MGFRVQGNREQPALRAGVCYFGVASGSRISVSFIPQPLPT